MNPTKEEKKIMKDLKEFHFVKFNKATIPNDRIFVNQNGMTIGGKVYEDMGRPKKISIYYDEKNKVIKLEPAKEGWTLFAYRAGVSFGCVAKLSKVMPIGKYNMEGGIFKLKEVNDE